MYKKLYLMGGGEVPLSNTLEERVTKKIIWNYIWYIPLLYPLEK